MFSSGGRGCKRVVLDWDWKGVTCGTTANESVRLRACETGLEECQGMTENWYLTSHDRDP